MCSDDVTSNVFSTSGGKGMKSFLAVLTVAVGCVGQANAGTITTLDGPSSFNHLGGLSPSWGIQFTALQNSQLDGFTFNHYPAGRVGNVLVSPFVGTVMLVDTTTHTTAFTANYAFVVGPITYSGLTVALHAGDVYQLTASSNFVHGTFDMVFQSIAKNVPPISYPASDGQISVTNGLFAPPMDNPFNRTHFWPAFTQIVTQTLIPEPSSYMILAVSMFGAGLMSWGRRRR
jgi:hypothetical protein